MRIFLTFIIRIALVLSVLPAVSFACRAQKASDALKLNTVVIDPGHGGKDAGCVSADRKTYEKNITLSVSQLLGRKIKERFPDVKVIYTRTNDSFIQLSRRADIANKNNVGLFISIHVNAAVKAPSANGFSVHVLGQSRDKNRDLFSYNSDICKRENSVILLEDDYSTKYQGFDPKDPESYIFFNLMQNAFYEQSLMFASCVHDEMIKGPIKGDRGLWQDPFLVLWKTTMPAALVEIGFMSNKSDLAQMRSETGQDKIAQRLCDAFAKYKVAYDKSVAYDEGLDAVGEDSDVGTGSYYGVQIMTLGRNLAGNDAAFKGYSHRAVKSGKMYRYIIGISSSADGAMTKYRSLKREFPGSFVVKVKDGVVTRLN